MPFLLLPFISLSFAFLFYVDAIKGGLEPKQWALAGLLLGPIAWPLLQVKKQIWFRQVCGYSGVWLKA
ncbi:hypothetical protein [Gallaecimonas mangrovi]|uniref:hypothetical protein n=1 Tax=Gallaecimonas mangrovi TaxID=2291597 RepID=UPI000E20A7F5|nr:hypothetical protein [Gallaecimonas mangrovi]